MGHPLDSTCKREPETEHFSPPLWLILEHLHSVKKKKKKKLSRNQKGEYSAESLKLVGNLGTDFRNCGHGPQEQAIERERIRKKEKPTPHSLLMPRKGGDTKVREPAVCSGPT